jgi:DNA primase
VWGVDRLDPELTTAVLTEGEIDALSFSEADIANAVSIPQGAREKPLDPFPWLAALEDFTVTLALDNDPTGRPMQRAILQRLGLHGCHIVEFPEGIKDANEFLCRHGVDALRELHRRARLATPADAEDPDAPEHGDASERSDDGPPGSEPPPHDGANGADAKAKAKTTRQRFPFLTFDQIQLTRGDAA